MVALGHRFARVLRADRPRIRQRLERPPVVHPPGKQVRRAAAVHVRRAGDHRRLLDAAAAAQVRRRQ
ncbi:hypothetical protein G6F57_023425 [Rhizopus arrhizus]|nr:hypothetical protein G6F32_017512 [Rhizopus arrhizus]KAG1224349.1 hypothetical protein G6F68_020132 [Rhizopus microsporus]KAG1424818.1 hypothetical protein G6F57_023425 [Rhizopus arrhizus]